MLALRNRGATAIQAFNTVGGQAKPPIVCFQESTPAAMVVSADGKRLAVGGVWRGTEEGLIQVCDIAPQADAVVQPESVWQIECEAPGCAKVADKTASPLHAVLFTTDGRIVTTTGDGPTRIWESCSASQLDLDRSRLLETHFVDCNLQHSNFQGAHLQQLTFERCDLRGANFRDAKLFSCHFNNCRLTRDVFRWAHVYSSCSYDPDLKDQIEEPVVS